MLVPGKTIGGYSLVCPIADGGMAHLWAARAASGPAAGSLVAFKVIHSRFSDNATFRAMFLDEARLVSSVRHPQVAQVYELGEQSDLLYLALEYVDGDSLFELIAPDRTVPLAIALRITADVCAGLHAVHGIRDEHGEPRNVVHRDVSPPNILVARSGAVKLIDFGIAHARGRAIGTTDEGSVKGTLRYMAPEQARREPLGPFTDVFGAGATLFRMLSGRAPYAAKSDIETMEALLAAAPSTASLGPDVPAPVAAIVQRAIAPLPANRFRTAEELRASLEGALAYLPPPDVAAWVQANMSAGARERAARVADAIRGTAAAAAPPPAPNTTVPMARPIAPREEAPPPGMMDIGALVARAKEEKRAEGAPPAPDAPRTAPKEWRPSGGAPPPDKARGAATGPSDGFGKSIKIAIFAVALVALLTGLLLALPSIVKDLAIGTAREIGLTMTVERAGVGFGGASLRGVKIASARAPSITASIGEIHITGLTTHDVRISNLDAHLEGPDKELMVELSALLADARVRTAGTAKSPSHLTVVDAKLTWTKPRGPDSKLTASEIGVDVESRGPGVEDARGKVGKLEIETPAAKLGPWGSSFDVSPATTRLRLLFDPPVSDGPSALLVSGRALPTELTVTVPRSSFTNLGVRPADFGIPIEPSGDVEIKVAGKTLVDGHAELKGELSLWGLKPQGFARPIDLRIDGGLTGAPDKPYDLTKTTVTVGPFVAAVTGTVTGHDGGFRLDALFKTLPLTCERLAQAEAKAHSPTAAALQALGQATGALRVTGNVNASGVIKYDTAEPSEASVTWVAKETCGVSIFGM